MDEMVSMAIPKGAEESAKICPSCLGRNPVVGVHFGVYEA